MGKIDIENEQELKIRTIYRRLLFYIHTKWQKVCFWEWNCFLNICESIKKKNNTNHNTITTNYSSENWVRVWDQSKHIIYIIPSNGVQAVPITLIPEKIVLEKKNCSWFAAIFFRDFIPFFHATDRAKSRTCRGCLSIFHIISILCCHTSTVPYRHKNAFSKSPNHISYFYLYAIINIVPWIINVLIRKKTMTM